MTLRKSKLSLYCFNNSVCSITFSDDNTFEHHHSTNEELPDEESSIADGYQSSLFCSAFIPLKKITSTHSEEGVLVE